MDILLEVEKILKKYNGVPFENLTDLQQKIYLKILEYKQSQGKNENIALYKHDCNDCTYMGDFLSADIINNSKVNFTYYDLYVHRRDYGVELVARYGDEPADYESATLFDSKSGVQIQPPAICLLNPFAEIFKRLKERCGGNI